MKKVQYFWYPTVSFPFLVKKSDFLVFKSDLSFIFCFGQFINSLVQWFSIEADYKLIGS
jgi:hypothetical protein